MSDQYVVISRTTGKPISHRVNRALAADIAATWDSPVVPDALTLRLWQPRPDGWTVTATDAAGISYLQADFDRAWAAELFVRALAGQWKADGALDVTVERQMAENHPFAPMLSQTDRPPSP
jgi:hypothetical protein